MWYRKYILLFPSSVLSTFVSHLQHVVLDHVMSQVDTATRNPESVKQGYLFEVPVQKWSRTERAFKNRLLALTKSSVVEMDVATRSVHRSGSSSRATLVCNCYCIVILNLAGVSE